MPTSSEWLYFASGALLPTLAYFWLIAPQQQKSLKSRSAAAATSGSSPSSAAAAKGGRGSTSTSSEPRRATAERSANNDEDADGGEDKNDDIDEGSSSEDDDAGPRGQPALDCSQWGYTDAPYKMMLVVNQELGMGKGKIAAQCGHASVGCYIRALQRCPRALKAWERTGCAKVAVKCPTTMELEQISALARSLGVPSYLVEDAGRTQIAAGSRTVLGLFGPAAVFGPLTDHLKLM